MNILYVNLEDATQRRQNIENQIRQHFPAIQPRRIPGVRVTSGDDRPYLSPHTQFLLAHHHKATAHTQIESWGAVGCYLSHVRCWEWIIDDHHRKQQTTLILEDDACFADHFPVVWRETVEPLLRTRHPAWDVLLLGFFEVRGSVATEIHGIKVRTLEPGGSFFGTHGYLVSARGAAIMREFAFPIEVQVDAYLLVLQQLGLLRLFLVSPSGCLVAFNQGTDRSTEIIHQCLGQTERGIEHRFNTISSEAHHHCAWMYVFALVLFVTVVVLLVVNKVRIRK